MIRCSAQVFEGHPFLVEAGVSIGGKDVKQVICCICFASFFSEVDWLRSDVNWKLLGIEKEYC